jgi:predicted transcriptional regulator
MPRKDEAVQLLRQGLPPSEIAHRMGTSTAAVMQYLCLKIGEGDLRRSDLAFSIPHEVRVAIEEAIESTGTLNSTVIARALNKRGIHANRLDVGVYINYRRARVVLGDMYELVRAVEVRLHAFVKQAFIAEFGEEQWWRSGVPDSIRAECAALLEKDPEPAEEPFSYTHLINLREIVDKRWTVLSKYMPPHLLNKKKDLLERLLRLNRIRNAVMHPVRNTALSEDEFEFVRDLEHDLGDLKAHIPAEAHEVPLSEELRKAETEETPASMPPRELVSRLSPVLNERPAPEDTATDEKHDAEDFIPGTKSA